MRVFLMAPDDHDISGRSPAVTAAASTLVWGVPASSIHGASADDVEEREFDALCEAVLVSATGRDPHARLTVLAGDLEPTLLAPEPSQECGEWAHRLNDSVTMPIKAILVSELTASATLEDDYAPQMLWFDPSEHADATAYAAGQDSAAS